MSKRRKQPRTRIPDEPSQPMHPAGWAFWAVVGLMPFGAVWIGSRHYRLFLGPKSFEEAWLLVLFALCMLGSALLVYVLLQKTDERSSRAHARWQQSVLRVIARVFLYTAAVIGPAALLVAIPRRHASDLQFSRFGWGLGLIIGFWVLGCILFSKSKNPVAKCLFHAPEPRPRPKWWPWPLIWY